jgi:geranylgeranyl pyrophosphate synthase
MDDDDVRRGRPTTHKAFGVNSAMIGGAAMIPLAASLAYDSAAAELVLPGETCCTIVKVLTEAAGGGG